MLEIAGYVLCGVTVAALFVPAAVGGRLPPPLATPLSVLYLLANILIFAGVSVRMYADTSLFVTLATAATHQVLYGVMPLFAVGVFAWLINYMKGLFYACKHC